MIRLTILYKFSKLKIEIANKLIYIVGHAGAYSGGGAKVGTPGDRVLDVFSVVEHGVKSDP